MERVLQERVRSHNSAIYHTNHRWVPVMNFVPGYTFVHNLWWLHKKIDREFESKMKSEKTDDDYYANYEYNENLMSEIMSQEGEN